jgi:phosphoribosylformimino-5-aminoimidazole carboxamide ribotide isomerase
MRVVEVEVADTYDLRRRVLLVPPRPLALEGDERSDTVHLGVTDGTGLLAVATLVPTEEGVQLRGMAVDPAAQGSGVGRLLVEAAVERLRAVGVTRMWCNARDTAVPFYERLGWRTTGPGFMHAESGLPHHPMELLL